MHFDHESALRISGVYLDHESALGCILVHSRIKVYPRDPSALSSILVHTHVLSGLS